MHILAFGLGSARGADQICAWPAGVQQDLNRLSYFTGYKIASLVWLVVYLLGLILWRHDCCLESVGGAHVSPAAWSIFCLEGWIRGGVRSCWGLLGFLLSLEGLDSSSWVAGSLIAVDARGW